MSPKEGHDVNWVAVHLHEQRATGEQSPHGVTIGSAAVEVPEEFRRLYGMRLENTFTDRYVAERMILERGGDAQYATMEEANQAKVGISETYPDWKLEVFEKDGFVFLGKVDGIFDREENLPTPPLKRVDKTTYEDADFADNTKRMLEEATPNTPILLGTQTTGNHLTAVKGVDGTFKLVISSGKRVIRTLFGIPSLEIAAEPPAGARVKWEGGEYFIKEAFRVNAPDVEDGVQLKYESIYSNPGHAQWLLNDSGMGVRFGTQSAGNHVDIIRLNGNTWSVCRTVDGATQPVETVQNLVLNGDTLVGVGVRGMRWEYGAKEVVALTSLTGNEVHQ
jgi:hypothetical protein